LLVQKYVRGLGPKRSSKCQTCKKNPTAIDANTDIEYTDSNFSLLVSSKSVKHSKEIFHELFDKVKRLQGKKGKDGYIG